ncbi:hypothetical protein DSO57_1028995 [Entomophthora muscae]|uniref:Uncharacterized protein n=1 Tax=Entomophthora muscae TaxID=34485 RepID=A0ACC2TZZ8_9FUNG|nr:hypothetical protein DSO57_1028995 [Entomophthora muscae]
MTENTLDAQPECPSSGEACNLPPITAKEITNCSFNVWYPLFKPHSIRSWAITLEPKVLDYLNSDTIIVPSQFSSKGEDQEISQLSDDELDGGSRLYNIGATTNSHEDSSDSESEEDGYVYLEQLNEEVRQAVSALGGEVFPKLNWSAPKDAQWIAPTKNLRCRDLSDILLLLKSSDDVAHDLSRAFDLCPSAPEEKPATVLVLKQWCNIDPAMEFRCFVIRGKLVGISQRDTNHYPFLQEEAAWLKPSITEYISDKVIPVFPNLHYAVDICIVHSSRTIKIIDFNPASPITHPLLFEWSELLQAQTTLWRVIRDTGHGQQAQAQRLRSNQAPADLANLGSSDLQDAIQQLSLLS